VRAVVVLAVVALLAGCGGAEPTPRSPAPPLSAPAPASASPPAGVAVSFAAPDGTTLAGHLFGADAGDGASAVVLSNMGDNDEADWLRFAPTLAAQGHTVLTYSYRYPPRTSRLTAQMARGAMDDLRGAVALVRARGAARVILIGASLGGMVTAKTAGALAVDGIVIMAAPADRPDFEMRVDAAELAAVAAPKLFVASDGDPTVDPAETRTLYDGSPEPKRWHTFPGTAHGTRLFGTAAGADLGRLLIEFVAGAVTVGPSASR
jgi:esterase/lipase